MEFSTTGLSALDAVQAIIDWSNGVRIASEARKQALLATLEWSEDQKAFAIAEHCEAELAKLRACRAIEPLSADALADAFLSARRHSPQGVARLSALGRADRLHAEAVVLALIDAMASRTEVKAA